MKFIRYRILRLLNESPLVRFGPRDRASAVSRPEVNVIKLFSLCPRRRSKVCWNAYTWQTLSALSNICETVRVEHLSDALFLGRLLALPANIRLGCKGLSVKNTQANIMSLFWDRQGLSLNAFQNLMEKIAKDKRNGSVCLLIGDGEKSFKTLTPELFGRNFLLKISALVFGMKVSGFGLGLLASLEMKEKSMNWWKCHKTLVFSLVTDNTLVCLKLVLNFLSRQGISIHKTSSKLFSINITDGVPFDKVKGSF